MPDENIQTIYYNESSGLEEWQCQYCSKTYLCSGGTGITSKYLEEFYDISKESSRDTTVKNIQKSLQAAFAYTKANLQKQQRLDTEEVLQDKLESL